MMSVEQRYRNKARKKIIRAIVVILEKALISLAAFILIMAASLYSVYLSGDIEYFVAIMIFVCPFVALFLDEMWKIK